MRGKERIEEGREIDHGVMRGKKDVSGICDDVILISHSFLSLHFILDHSRFFIVLPIFHLCKGEEEE